MQPASGGGGNELTRGGGGGGGGGGGVGGGGGLTRFRSAPATWLEALLEEEVETDVVLDSPTILSSKPPPPQPPTSATAADLGFLDSIGSGGGGGGISAFLRQNSSPAEFASHLNSDDYFPSIGVPPTYDYLMPSTSPQSSSSTKRPRTDVFQTQSPKLSSQLKGEQSEQSYGEMGGFLDVGLEKLAEDSVLCRARAKRGFATHPRSIAERVRRTRISDRIRKLQELVPNMDKQTNTADMLEEAVEYVKFLKKQIQELTEHQKRCKCSSKE